VETTPREHFAVEGFQEVPFSVSSRWFAGACSIKTYRFNELLGTKLRALYQRRKGRDLFDLGVALEHDASDPEEIVRTFNEYMRHAGLEVRRREFEENLARKMEDRRFLSDIGPLLSSEFECDFDQFAKAVREQLIARLAA
jgi:predicted nucleotidyltransferase component of viral defense system